MAWEEGLAEVYCLRMNVIALNLLSAWKAHRTRDLSRREQSQLATVGGISLFCWLTAVMAGRMIGYW